MPELPEVQALVDFLGERTRDLAIVGVELGSISVLKTYDPPPASLHGLPIDSVIRHGKFIDIEAEGLHLVFHLARAGWLRWSDALASTTIRPGKSSVAFRCRLSDGSGFDLTEAGTRKRVAVYIVRDPAQVPGIARLGPDPMAADFTAADFAGLLQGRRTQVKGLLKDRASWPESVTPIRTRCCTLHGSRRLRWLRAWITSRSRGCLPRCATRSSAPSPPRPANRPRS